jgi:hypothetical protein
MRKKELPHSNSPTLQSNTFPTKRTAEITKPENQKLSVFNDSLVTRGDWIAGVSEIKKAFPEIPENWFDVLGARIKDKKFTAERFKKAVENLIDTCRYPKPTPAEIISFDKKIVCYNQLEFMEQINKHGQSIQDVYEKIDINGAVHFVPKGSIEKYGLKKFELKKI